MGLDSIVNVNITKATSAPTQAGFGTPLLMVSHSVTASVLAAYGSVKAITDAGFPVTHPAVKMATAIFSQNPRPPQVLIGKRSNAFTQTIELVPKITTPGFHYQLTVVAPSGASWDIDYTVLNGATVATICTALTPLLDNANADITTTDGTTKITMACAAGKLFDLKNLPNPDHLAIKDVTADPGIAADLTAVEALDSTTWYGILLDYAGKLTTQAAAAWTEARRKLLGADTTDSEIADNAVTTDLASNLKTSAYARTFLLFSQNQVLSYSAAAWMGVRFPTNPGRATWAYCTLAGVPASKLTDGQQTNIKAKNCNIYYTLAGLNSTEKGILSVGEYIDIAHGTDWLHARTQERVFGVIKNASDSGKKIAFTDAGADIIRGTVLAQLDQAASDDYQLLKKSPAPTVVVPKVKDVSDADKANRTLPDVTFDAEYAGAIHATKINGTITL